MTDQQRREIETQAATDHALLSGRWAQGVMFFLAEVLAIGPMLYWIPEFTGWRDVVAWLAAIAVVATAPAISLLIPRDMQEHYRQALLESAERRRAAVVDAENARAFARTVARSGKSDGSNGSGGDVEH